MTAEGILARGKANHEAGKFKNNSETLAYTKTLSNDVEPSETKEEKEEKVEESK